MFDMSSEFWKWLLGQAAILVVAYFGLEKTVAVLSSKHDTLEKKVDEKIESLEAELKAVSSDQKEANTEQNVKLNQITDLLVRSARFEERQSNTDQQLALLRAEVYELRHYRGFVNGAPNVPAVIP